MRSLDENHLVSVVAPAYNETGGIDVFLDAVHQALTDLNLPCPFEVVVVDDGSTDGTMDQLESLVARYPATLRVIRLSRNFGFCAAVTAALRHATGDVVILMDADMQDDPAAFSTFLEKWREGYDVVYAVRTGRNDSKFVQTLTWAFYRALRVMAQIPLPLDAGNYALMDRRAVDALATLPENNRYLPGLRCWVGFRQIGIPVERRAREDGRSRMGLRKLYDLAIMALFSFSFMPLFVFRLFGIGALAVALALVPICLFLAGVNIISWTGAVILVALSFFSGINLLGIGILGEYVALIYDEVRRRPLYIVDKIVDRTSISSNARK